MQSIISFNIAIFLIIFPVVVLAHGDGPTFEETKDGYFVDIGYDTDSPTAGDRIRFDLSATPEVAGTSTDAVFDDVWVRITHEAQLVFSGGISRPVIGATGFIFTFPTGGDYEITTRFQKDGKSLVETSFPLTVATAATSEATGGGMSGVLLGIIGLLVGALLGFLLTRRSR